MYKVSMHVHARYLHTAHVHMPTDEVLDACLRTQAILLRKKKDPTAPLPLRFHPPCALCEKDGHPTNKCPSLLKLRNLIQLPRATPPLDTSSNSPSTTIGKKRATNQIRMCHMFRVSLSVNHMRGPFSL
jgi:hypothetical protein